MRGLAVILLLACGTANSANINNAADFQITKSSTELYWYLQGVLAGYSVNNAALKHEGQPMLYCQPVKLMNTGMNLIGMVEQQLPKAQKTYSSGLKDLPIEFVLLDALQETFPCQ